MRLPALPCSADIPAIPGMTEREALCALERILYSRPDPITDSYLPFLRRAGEKLAQCDAHLRASG